VLAAPTIHVRAPRRPRLRQQGRQGDHGVRLTSRGGGGHALATSGPGVPAGPGHTFGISIEPELDSIPLRGRGDRCWHRRRRLLATFLECSDVQRPLRGSSGLDLISADPERTSIGSLCRPGSRQLLAGALQGNGDCDFLLETGDEASRPVCSTTSATRSGRSSRSSRFRAATARRLQRPQPGPVVDEGTRAWLSGAVSIKAARCGEYDHHRV